MRTSLSSRSIAAVGLTVLAAVSAPAMADEIIVPTDHPLSVAIALAQSGDTITILPGIYQQVPGISFANKQLTIRGSTGNPADVVIDGADYVIVLTISGAGAAGSVVQDLTIANGRGGTATDSSGAGVHISGGANVTFRHCVIRDNVVPAADGNGAGIYATGSSIRLETCVFENNSLSSNIGDGGGVYFNGGSHVILDTLFRSNGTAPDITPIGGSIGGGLYADSGSAQITRCIFQGNRSAAGAGMGVRGSEAVTIDESVFADNVAVNGAGFLIESTAGGAPPRIRNSLFVGNAALQSAAIFTDKGGQFSNLTIVGNSSSMTYIVGGNSATGTLIVDNSILWGNSYNTADGLFPAATPDLVRRCILQQAYTGAAGSGFNQVVDPLFVNFGTRDFHLTNLSPAIDAGDSSLYFGPFCDLDGNERAADVPEIPDAGSSISGPVIDIGAYEFQVEPPPPDCPPDFNRDGILNSQDFFDFLTQFFTGC